MTESSALGRSPVTADLTASGSRPLDSSPGAASLGETFAEVRVPRGSGTLAAFVGGDPSAPPVLVLHGAAGSTHVETRPLVERWSGRARVVALDFAGHGRSDDLPEIAFSLDTFREDALAALDHLGIERAAVFGFSLGAGTALTLAARQPERVSRVHAHAGAVEWTEEEWKRQAFAFKTRYVRRLTPAWAARLERAHGAGRWETLLDRLFGYMQEADHVATLSPEELGRIECPVLLSVGDRDRYLGLEQVVRTFRSIPNALLSVLPGHDHHFDDADPDAFAAVTEAFLLDGRAGLHEPDVSREPPTR